MSHVASRILGSFSAFLGLSEVNEAVPIKFKFQFLVLIIPLPGRRGEYHDSVGVIISFSSEIKSPQDVAAGKLSSSRIRSHCWTVFTRNFHFNKLFVFHQGRRGASPAEFVTKHSSPWSCSSITPGSIR